MTRRYVRRRYRRNPTGATPGRRTASLCAELDAESFEALVQARVCKLFGGSLEQVAPDPLLRQAVHDAVVAALRRPERPVPPDSLALAARLRKHGITITLGASDIRDLPEPLDLGWSL